MKLSGKSRSIITNLLIAIAISVIVNIADILIVMRETAAVAARMAETENVVMDTLIIRGKPYTVPPMRQMQRGREGGVGRDSIAMRTIGVADSLIRTYVPDSVRQAISNEMPRLQLAEPGQDSSAVTVTASDSLGMRTIKVTNRVPTRWDYRVRWAVSQSPGYQSIQLLFFFALGFILISIATYNSKKKRSGWDYPIKMALCVLIAVVAYFLAPRVNWNGEIVSTISFLWHDMYDPTLLLKCALVLIVAALYGKIYELISQRQTIIVENEILKTENLQATYNTLINQVNRHFFFNSLNSLSMLVREKHNPQALTYIDRLSDTFRYILQNGATGDTTLEEEVKFTDAYKYLLEIRYEGKLFINFDIDPAYLSWTLPSLTLQPLLENAVKHNTITKSEPLHINIFTDGKGNVCVSNTVNPKMDKGEGTGIGLKNLSERYKLLMDKDITVINDNKEFLVILPLKSPES